MINFDKFVFDIIERNCVLDGSDSYSYDVVTKGGKHEFRIWIDECVDADGKDNRKLNIQINGPLNDIFTATNSKLHNYFFFINQPLYYLQSLSFKELYEEANEHSTRDGLNSYVYIDTTNIKITYNPFTFHVVCGGDNQLDDKDIEAIEKAQLIFDELVTMLKLKDAWPYKS